MAVLRARCALRGQEAYQWQGLRGEKCQWGHLAARENIIIAASMAETPPCASCGAPCRSACGGCRTVFYCSKACQKAHWAQHKRACREAGAAAGPLLDALDLFDRVSRPAGPLCGADLCAFAAAADALNGEQLLRRVSGASYPTVFGTLHRFALHDAAELPARLAAGPLILPWWGLACITLNARRLTASTVFLADPPLCAAAFAHVPDGGARGDVLVAALRLAAALQRARAPPHGPTRDWLERHTMGVWRALCQMSEHGGVAAEMLAGLGGAEEQALLAGCLVVPGNDALEGLANMFAAQLCVHAARLPAGAPQKGLERRLLGALSAPRRAMFTGCAKVMAVRAIDKHCGGE